MELNTFLKLIRLRRRTVLYFGIIFLIISLIFTFTQPLKYGAKTKLLVVQSASGADPYTVSKSNEYLGNLFSQVVYSSSFFDLVMTSQFNIDENYFGNNSNKQMKAWKKVVATKSLGDTGIISINVYHPDPYQARQIALAVNDVLINKNFNYQGLGSLVRVTVIDQPIVSNYPVKPNISLNLILAVFSGIVVGMFYTYLLPEERYAFSAFSRRTRKPRKKTKKQITKESAEIIETINKEEEDVETEDFSKSGDINNILQKY